MIMAQYRYQQMIFCCRCGTDVYQGAECSATMSAFYSMYCTLLCFALTLLKLH